MISAQRHPPIHCYIRHGLTQEQLGDLYAHVAGCSQCLVTLFREADEQTDRILKVYQHRAKSIPMERQEAFKQRVLAKLASLDDRPMGNQPGSTQA